MSRKSFHWETRWYKSRQTDGVTDMMKVIADFRDMRTA